MHEQNKKASELLDDIYMEKQAIAFSGKKLEDVENGESYGNKDTLKDIGGNAAIIGASRLASKGMLAKGAYDLANGKVSSKYLNRAHIPGAIGTIVGLTGIGAGIAKRIKSGNNDSEGQYRQASDILNDMYMEKISEDENLPDDKPKIDYKNLEIDPETGKVKLPFDESQVVSRVSVNNPVTGKPITTTVYKDASDVLNEMYMQKTAGVTNTPRLYYQENR